MQFRLRSLVQFRLATLLIAITLIGVWLGVWADRANRQKRAVAAIKAAGGVLTFDYERDSQGNLVKNARPPAPQLLRRLIGEDYFRRVVVVEFARESTGQRQALELSKIDDKGLACLQLLPDLEELAIANNGAVTDAGLAHLRNLRKLRALALYDCGVTGTGCAQLAPLDNLRWLNVSRSPLTPAGLVEIGRLQQLEVLYLSQTPVTDGDLRALLPLRKLTTLRLDQTRVTAAGVAQLQGLLALKELSVPAGLSPTEMDQVHQALPHCELARPLD